MAKVGRETSALNFAIVINLLSLYDSIRRLPPVLEGAMAQLRPSKIDQAFWLAFTIGSCYLIWRSFGARTAIIAVILIIALIGSVVALHYMNRE